MYKCAVFFNLRDLVYTLLQIIETRSYYMCQVHSHPVKANYMFGLIGYVITKKLNIVVCRHRDSWNVFSRVKESIGFVRSHNTPRK